MIFMSKSDLRPRAANLVAIGVFVLLASVLNLYAADATAQVELNVTKAGPRTVENLTERGILRDYRFAWTSMAQALEFNTLDPLEGPFAGDAKKWLQETVSGQQRDGLSQRYLNQNHKLEAVFYAPEGDVMELHDTAEYQLQISDGGKLIHDEHVVMHYVVLMTPAADRWVVRQLQAVRQF
jgi:hemin uptake protein HemP